MKTILFFGATSKIGRPLIDLLDAAQNVKVIAAVRTQLNADLFEAKGIATRLIDLDIYEASDEQMQGLDPVASDWGVNTPPETETGPVSPHTSIL